jgi:AmmeMemoRadiSam system radical SAM enzyme/AmmeMemoRadiSam system protein B/uncharacterized protein (TIGR00296 family)
MDLNNITKKYINNIKVDDLLNKSSTYNIENINSIIVPHAGYFYSGDVASESYKQLKNIYDNVFIIATSHKNSFKGAKLMNNDEYYDININLDIVNKLNNNDYLTIDNNIFLDDHNLDIQLPFIKKTLSKSKIIPIMVGDSNIEILKKISIDLNEYFDKKSLFIISSDLSHYPTYKNALKIDNETIKIIQKLNIDKFIDYNSKKIPNLSTKMCGWSSILILLYLLQDKINIKSKLIKYKNSGHVTNDKTVVGYSSIIFYKYLNFNLSYDDKLKLLSLSRLILNRKVLLNDKSINIKYKNISNNLKQKLGCFVTLTNTKIKNNLRGCIGLFNPNYYLIDTIKNVTISSYNDDRFNNITKDELLDINIEISILTPFKKISNIDDIIIGKHGIYIEKDGKSGTYLPQVILDTKWNIDETLGNCSLKAGLKWDDWKTSNIYVYESIIFDERHMYKESMYYEKLNNNKVKCNLCPHYCILSDNDIGICKSRINIEGYLYTMTYNNPSITSSIDPIEKKPLKMFYPGQKIYSLCTNGCNMKCDNCQNYNLSQMSSLHKEKNISPMSIVKECKNMGLNMIAFTYTEPTIFYEYMLDISKIAKKNNIKTVLVSNGYINEEPLKELLQYIDAANIDLKFFDEKKHKKITKSELKPVLNTIKIINNSKTHLEISNLIINGLNDNENEINKMYQWFIDNNMSNVPIHLLKFFPIYKLTNKNKTTDDIIEKIYKIAKSKGLKYIYF